MNKKILAILMALLMVLMGSVAMAADEIEEGIETGLFQLTKKYYTDSTYATEVTTNIPQEAIILEQVGEASASQYDVENPVAPTLTPLAKAADSTTAWNSLKFSNFQNAGVFTYTVKEKNLGTAGVTYDTKQYTVAIAVGPKADGKGYEPLYVKIADGTKKIADGELKNVFDYGTLVINKQITGDLSVATDVFPVKVVMKSDKPVTNTITITASGTAPTTTTQTTTAAPFTNNISETTVYVTHDTTLTFNNIPAGVVIESVTESTKTVNGRAYTAAGELTTATTVADAGTTTVSLVNTCTATVDTGIFTDNMPYFMLMAFVMILAAAVVLKKRTVNE